MCALKIFSVLIILSILHVSVVRCFKPKNYCDQKYMNNCTQNSFSFHVGCSNRTAKVAVPLKLTDNERITLTNYFNDIRNQIASNKSISEMYALSWSEEYEYLAEQAIEKLFSVEESGCYWTENSKEFPTEIKSSKIATKSDIIWAITGSHGASFYYNLTELPEVEFSKLNKISYLLGEEEKKQIMGYSINEYPGHPITALHDPSSNLIGCAWMIYQNSTYDLKQIRCAINGRSLFNTSAYTLGARCSKCPAKCSKIYTHLCSSSDKFKISFWLVCLTVFLAFDKLFK